MSDSRAENNDVQIRKSIRLLFLLLLAVSPSPLFAASPLSLDEALVMALKKHPQLIEARENVNGSEARTGQALANYYPQISVVADWSKGRSFFGPLERAISTEVHTEAMYLKQTIYDFGRTKGSVDAAQSAREAAAETVAIARQDVALRVRIAFYLLLAAEKQVLATGETVRAREAVFQQAQEFFIQGIRAKVEVSRAEANLYAAKTALIRAENNRDLAKVELANSIGIPSLADRQPVAPAIGSAPLPDESQVLQEAISRRSELKQLDSLGSVAAANLKTARSGYLPILSGTASVGYADRSFPPGDNVWGVGLNLTMPLFSGFSTREQEKESLAALRGVEARKNSVKLQVVKDVKFAWLGVREATDRIVSTKKEVAAAGENQALAMGRYQEGVGTIVEVTDAQAQALDADTAHIQAVYDYQIALARLDRAVGKE
ncbi:efflux pump, RND family, outer membrane protein [Geotalea daltonii FRC-32]|uniref:Efflux pump, RND family, outer membrane protein n=1 Tax=Geotalea daltonii (strain DSM 22248 / JCM 15807 / FRC-32) TaxID=316067 RepID=B9M123_GEODF|nr:TolC family protein [Geotalea daltonii]ACM19093.1 efflux pump, RND family, outer membrane protein [Geotalea daltonii FRC-32]